MELEKFNLPYRRKLLYKRKKRRQIIISLLIFILISLPISLTIISNMKNNNKFIATINKTSVTSKDKFEVCIDAGHGDWDVGAIGISGAKEKDIVLNIALKVGVLLKSQGIKVMYTRTTDSQNGILTANDSLKERLKISKVSKSNIFISIHCNSDLESKDTKGLETWYKPQDTNGMNLASLVQDKLTQLNYTTNREVKSYDNKDDALAVLEKNTATPILIELGFLSNVDDEYYLTSEKGQEACAKAILEGILDYKKMIDNTQ